MRKYLLAVTILFLLLPPNAVVVAAPQAQTGTVAVTVSITHVVELFCDEDLPLESCPNDYYPKFEVDHQGLFNGKDAFCCAHPEGDPLQFSPSNWTKVTQVDSSHNSVQIHVELWDQDDYSGDDELDIGSGSPRSMDLTFDMNTCTFQGQGVLGAGTPGLLEGQSAGQDKDNAHITFRIATDDCIRRSYNVDSDRDGLMDGWEITGIDIENPSLPNDQLKVLPVLDGTPDLALGTSPLHKDLFVEVDWMECSKASPCVIPDHSHKPDDGVFTDVPNAFAAAPVSNPDGSTGITLHLEKGEAVTDLIDIAFEFSQDKRPSGSMDDFDDIKIGKSDIPCDGFFGTPADRTSSNCAKILAAKKLVFRYMIFGHSFKENNKSSGIAETGGSSDPTKVNQALGGNDFMVTLGEPFDAPCKDKTGNPCIPPGQRRVYEASTFMHEFGHTLGLLHGGDERFVNCKPNYQSVMNYALQFPEYDPNRPMDYSTGKLKLLNENGGLDETKGLEGPAGRLVIYGVGGSLRKPPANQASIDWNEIKGLETAASADINFLSLKGGCDTATPNENLHDWDDWGNLKYSFRSSDDFADGTHGVGDLELTGEMLMSMRAQADLKLVKTVDKSTAIGGDTLNYNVTTTNLGPRKAINISLTDVLPDGSTQTGALPDLDNNGSNTKAFTFLVPCMAADGAVFTNNASVTGTDESGIPDPNSSNNTAQASTTVRTPVLTLSKTATATVNAGEAITYTIAYENAGSGAAANVVITDILAAGVYYSKALDLGTGPQPDTVTLNADGTRTLTWNVGAVSASSGPKTIVYTARSTLLALGGTSYSNNVSLSFQNSNGCVYEALNASTFTSITVVPPTRDPLTLGFWRTHPEQWTSEILARIQATDQRYDINADGALSTEETKAMLAAGGNQPKVLKMQLLATYFDLGTRRINADTVISSQLVASLGLTNVRDAALFAMNTLLLPVKQPNAAQYDSATRALDEINNNKSEVYQ